MCLDHNGRQSPPLQGMFAEVADNITKLFKPDEVSWLYFDGKEFIELSLNEWMKKGQERYGFSIEEKPIEDVRFLGDKSIFVEDLKLDKGMPEEFLNH